MTSVRRPGQTTKKGSSPSRIPGRQPKAAGFRDVVPNVRDHGVKPPAKSVQYDPQWVFLSEDLKLMYLSHFARWGVWSGDLFAMTIPPAIVEQAEALRRQFLRDPRHEGWLGDYPGPGV
jgi:hypothetical protein